MIENISQTTPTNKDTRPVPIDLEFDHYLFEVFFNDRVDHEIQRMMEYEKESGTKTNCYDKPFKSKTQNQSEAV